MKKVKILTITLAVILIVMIAVFGIYVQVQNRMENKVKNYSYAMDLKGTRNVVLEVDNSNKTIIKDSEGKEVDNADSLTDEEIAEKGYTKVEVPYNAEDVKNEENYNKSKKIIEKRLEKLDVDNYTIKLDKETGKINLEIPENTYTDSIISNMGTPGKFEIVDSDTDEVLMDNNDIKLANVMYGSDSTNAAVNSEVSTTVYLNIEFTKEGAKKLEDISSKYKKSEDKESTENTSEEAKTEEETSEEDSQDAEETEKKITMKVDDEEIMSTSFSETLKTGKLQLSVGRSSNNVETIENYRRQAANMANVLDTGNIPIKYEIEENKYVQSDITRENLQIVKYVIAAIIAIALILMTIRFKLFGFLGAISYAGLIALFLLLIRYTNVILSLEGIFGIAIIMLLNYKLTNKILLKIKEKNYKTNKEELKEIITETYKEFLINIIPILITVITFCFIKWAPISSFGMVMFWGIILIIIYNFLITNNVLKIKLSK